MRLKSPTYFLRIFSEWISLLGFAKCQLPQETQLCVLILEPFFSGAVFGMPYFSIYNAGTVSRKQFFAPIDSEEKNS
jgi:hypothetical protein